MKRVVMRFHRTLWLGVCLVGLVALAITVTVYGRVTSRAASPSFRAIYLTDTANPVLDSKVVQAAGAQVVQDVPALTAGVSAADVVIFDSKPFAAMSQIVLGSYLQQGKIIVGLNIPATRLEQIPGYRQPNPPDRFREDWQGRPFFSLIYQRQQGSTSYTGASSDVIYGSESFIKRLQVVSQSILSPSMQVSGSQTPAPATAVRTRP